jgi:glucosamine--fructose-6-phosphate aminotransferase (isomerizing)
MCGIVGCVGHEKAPEFVTETLKKLEYRGYDSAGLAYPSIDSLQVLKSLGRISNLESLVQDGSHESATAIGHTRWATNGEVSIENAHPHTNSDQDIAVVHNGTIDNSDDLRTALEYEGYTFSSETDTEVIPHLLDYYLKEGQEPDSAFESTIKRLEGAYAILAIFNNLPNTIYAARLGSPLVLGAANGEQFAASDHKVFKKHPREFVFLDDHEIAELSPGGYSLRHIKKGMDTTRPPQKLDTIIEEVELGDFPHYMIKEIHDSPRTVKAAVSGRVLPEENIVKLGGLESVREKLRETDRILIVACGTSFHAGLVGERLIEEIAGIPVEVQLASEFQYSSEPLDRRTAVIAISQSGETADTIGALKKAKDIGLLTLGIVNSPGSAIDRETEAGVHLRAGEELSVASTKAFTSQVTVLAATAIALSRRSNELHGPLMKELVALPDKIEAVLENAPAIETAAKKYAGYKNFLYIGRGYEYPSALEGALKLKEISYIHAEGCGAGEMKHGTLALIDEDFPTMAIATDGKLYVKTLGNIEEIKARKGPVIALANEGNSAIQDKADDVLYVPKTFEQLQPILNGIALQLFAYYVAVEKGLNVDRPRNLAKSVTVE